MNVHVKVYEFDVGMEDNTSMKDLMDRVKELIPQQPFSVKLGTHYEKLQNDLPELFKMWI